MLTPARLLLFRAVFFCFYGAIGVLFPYFILHLRSGVGLNEREITVISSLSGLTVVLFQQLWGYVADVLISRKSLLLFTSLGSALLFLIIGFLTQQWSIAVVMFLFNALFTSINQLLHSFLFAHGGSEKYFGLFRAWGSLGFVVTNIGTGIWSDRMAGGDLTFIFPTFVAVTLVSVALLMPLPEAPRIVHERQPTFMEVQKFFLARRDVAFFLLMAFVYQAAHTPSFMLQSLLMADMGADRSTISFSYSLAALLELPVFFLSGRLIARYGELKLIAFCAVIQALRWMLVWMSWGPVEIVLVSMLHCITFGLFYAAGVSFMNRRAGLQLKASAQTLFAMVIQGLAGIFGNIVGGQALAGGLLSPGSRWITTHMLHLPDYGDLRNLYVMCALFSGLSLLLALGLFRIRSSAL